MNFTRALQRFSPKEQLHGAVTTFCFNFTRCSFTAPAENNNPRIAKPLPDGRLKASLQRLKSKLEGEIILPSSVDKYERERKQWNEEFNNYYPPAIIMAETEEDICASLKELILKECLPFRVRSCELGGHLWNGYSVANDSIILDLSRFNWIEKVKNTKRRFKIGVGASQRNVNRNLEPYFGLIPTSGDCPQFAFGGFIQGGGLSLFLRSFGIAADYVVAADVVLTNGNIVQLRVYTHCFF